MKYYCPECNAEYTVNNDRGISFCSTFDEFGSVCNVDLVEIPDYETPEQYEKRTGKPVDDDMAVFYRINFGAEGIGNWIAGSYWAAKTNEAKFIVIADPPVPPPYEWEPEVSE